MEEIWGKVDEYFAGLLIPPAEAQAATAAANRAAGLPAIDVSPLQGKFLALLVQISGARRILEIGTLGGYSTIWMTRAAGAGAHVVTLEYSPDHAKVARANIEAAGLSGAVTIHTGRALDTLPKLAEEDGAPFDLIFIDADKRSNPDYLDWALRLSRSGTLIIVDNVVREGRVIDAASRDADVQGIRRFAERLAAEPRLNSTALQTVGTKGHDGFTLSRVL
jgi:predicted O-methyltransferase YrrM